LTLTGSKQAAGIAEYTELEGIAELIMAAATAFDYRKVGECSAEFS
jgi:hypothetical protein